MCVLSRPAQFRTTNPCCPRVSCIWSAVLSIFTFNLIKCKWGHGRKEKIKDLHLDSYCKKVL